MPQDVPEVGLFEGHAQLQDLSFRNLCPLPRLGLDLE